MVTADQASANVKTATRVLARDLGFYVNDGSGFDIGALTPAQQIQLTNSLAAYIKGHPELFDTGAADLTNPYNSAAYATNALPSDASLSFDEFADSFLANARAINPLDPANIGTVGKYVLTAAVIVGLGYLAIKFLPDSIARAKIKAP